MKNLSMFSVFLVLAVLFLPVSGFASNPISTMPVDNFVTAYNPDGSFTVTRGENFKAFFKIDKDNPNEIEVTVIKDNTRAVHINGVIEAAGYTFRDSTFNAIAIPLYSNPSFYTFQPAANQPEDGGVIENQGGTIVRTTTITAPTVTNTIRFNAPAWIGTGK